MNCFSGSSGGLSPNKRALLQRVLQQEGLQPSPPPQIARRPQSDHLPLSFAQQRLWFLEQWEPARIRLYNLQGFFPQRYASYAGSGS